MYVCMYIYIYTYYVHDGRQSLHRLGGTVYPSMNCSVRCLPLLPLDRISGIACLCLPILALRRLDQVIAGLASVLVLARTFLCKHKRPMPECRRCHFCKKGLLLLALSVVHFIVALTSHGLPQAETIQGLRWLSCRTIKYVMREAESLDPLHP